MDDETKKALNVLLLSFVFSAFMVVLGLLAQSFNDWSR